MRSTNQTAEAETAPGPGKEPNHEDDDFEWPYDLEESSKEEEERSFQRIVLALRSAFLIHFLERGLPESQRGMFYFLLVQFHEDLDPPLNYYSALPAILMWYLPHISPLIVYSVTRVIDMYRKDKNRDAKEVIIPAALYGVSSFLSAKLVDFRGTTELLETVFGPATKWPAALLPIFPGIFLRFIHERPNSINGFVPENKQGITMAIFVRACTAVLPPPIQWPIWCAYTAPGLEYPAMFVDWLFCTYSWIYLGISPLGAYAIWLVVNQYRHPNTWFRLSGGGPSVILQRERRGTLWYMTTIIIVQLVENEAGPAIVESGLLILYPQVWIPLALIVAIGIYLLKFGLLLRIYKYKHEPFQKGGNIRLLRLRAQPCLPNSPIQCDMIHTSLRRPPQYTAVSHRWDPIGTPEATQEMILIDGGLFPVSRSIHSLLLAKRSNLHPRYFWIDSISIDQNDNTEKSRQVGLVRNIFEEAEMALGWLGDDPGAKKAFSFIKRVNETRSPNSFSTFCSEPDSGWSEFEKLMSNEWFERVWIIQEVAVAKASVLRYGDQEMDWSDFTQALARVILFGFQMESHLHTLLDRREILSVLIMEEIRSHIANVDLVKLKDILKLALRFKATLPIDKVYALLGLNDERHTPLFHPKFGASDGIGNNKVFDSRMLWKDVLVTLELLNSILGTAGGRSNSRRGRAILSAGTVSAVRYTKLLTRDLHTLHKKIKRMQDGTPDFEEDSIQPDYSEKTTAQLVYTYVVRDLVKQNDGLSFIRHAGIGHSRNPALTGLPSWVPDWSTDFQVYLLPWRKLDVSGGTGSEPNAPQPQTPVFHDGGLNFLFIKGFIVGTITHSVGLMQDFGAAQSAKREDIEVDFFRSSSNFQAALKLAQQYVRPHYKTDDALEEAFHRTLTVDTTFNSNLHAASTRPWTHDISADCHILAALRPGKFKDYWEKNPRSDDPEALHRRQAEIYKKYSFIRRMKSSANSKFTHLVRTDIVPSFLQYREQDRSLQGKSRFSMLDNESSGPFSGYAQYVDYTIGRSFIITDTGLMGLASSCSKKGDIVIQLQTNDRVVWLTLREEEYPECSRANDVTSSNETKASPETDGGKPSHRGTFRLVGEAYVHNCNSEPSQTKDLQWFKLW